jgi:hypothetical protein
MNIPFYPSAYSQTLATNADEGLENLERSSEDLKRKFTTNYSHRAFPLGEYCGYVYVGIGMVKA